ncbi:hypothetical protein ABL78_0146 [Leptomonas seymouri]|uniref:Uncharacterized protein n=1 Tax=Leptomonas seymouri TaxID=5684 RepID=A0A0N1I2D0_LEPSE|nr:hypothetical protein ABL78_0146 [Leptomonas seymouri]|eukprot:KPI90710.1 hypothetical protein ABL78_0146 [Leptomonas seymouri]
MPTFKKPRNKGVTYKLIPRSYGDANSEEGPVWVSEAEFYRNHQNPTAQEEEEKAQQQFRLYAAAANAEFKEERRRRRRTDDEGGEETYFDEEEHGDYNDDEGEYYGEEGEWMDGDWEEEEGEWEGEEEEWEGEAEAVASPPHAVVGASTSGVSNVAAADGTKKVKTVSFALQGPTASTTTAPLSPYSAAATAAQAGPHEQKRVLGEDADEHDHGEENAEGRSDGDEGAADEDEKLFEDEVECEVTDDFLRQLVFGNGGVAGDGDGDDDDFMMDDDEEAEDWDGLDQEDGEMWRLLTDEEKAAIKASRRRGTARRRKMATAGGGEAVTRTHAADGTQYPTHDVTQRAVDRQFTEMMREFNADARLNDAYTDDPRTHGALPMEKYMAALEEFVVDRAGMDVETAEPHKNKGLIQQLKYLSHHAGAFDSDGRGTYMTTLLPEKQQRFVEEFQKGSEEIRQAARKRLAQRQQAAVAAALIVSPSATAGTLGEAGDDASGAAASSGRASAYEGPVEEEPEEMIVLEVKPKADRLDCETAVSAYSTYYNQPNVIQAPRKSNLKRRAEKRMIGVVKGNVISSSSQAAEATDKTGRGTTRSSTGNTAATPRKTSGQKSALHAPSSNDDDYDGDHHYNSDEGEVAPTNAQRALNIVPTVRPKGETKEEKKLRRQAVKMAQSERRQAKSALKSLYRNVESDEVKRSATSKAARRTVHFM